MQKVFWSFVAGIEKGSKIVLTAEGEDEVEALNELENYLESGLGESV